MGKFRDRFKCLFISYGYCLAVLLFVDTAAVTGVKSKGQEVLSLKRTNASDKIFQIYKKRMGGGGY